MSTSREALSDESSSWSINKADIDPAIERRVVRKLDLYLVPMMTMFYLLSFLDRANIGNARIANMQNDLKLTDYQYQIAVTILYVPYILAELPSNLLLRKIRPSILMPTVLTLWGMICALQGTVRSFAGLVTIRAFLGLVEGPMFPGIVLYLSGFYTRRELSLRIALFFSAASLSGAFSGLLAAAIQNMDGVRGYPGWAWIFILEGIFTVVIGLLSFFIVPSTPRDLRFFTPNEKEIITRRLGLDRPSATSQEQFSWREVACSAFKSPHVAITFVALFFDGTILYGLALFLPSIVNQLKLGGTHTSIVGTQLVSVGPFAAGFFVTLITAYLSDRLGKRSLFAIINSLIGLAGYILFLRSKTSMQAYGSLFLSVSGAYANAPILSAWMANNSEPHYRRATSIALGFVATNAGGILSTWSYPRREGPHFRRASIMNIVFSIGIALFSIINVLYLRHANRSKKLHRNDILSRYTVHENPGTDYSRVESQNQNDANGRAWADLGDRHPDFKYTL